MALRDADFQSFAEKSGGVNELQDVTVKGYSAYKSICIVELSTSNMLVSVVITV